MDPLRDLASKAAWRFHSSAAGRVAFNALQAAGVHVVPNHFYLPIPDTRTMGAAYFEAQSDLPGLDMRLDAQVDLLQKLASEFKAEYEKLPRSAGDSGPDEFYLNNQLFEAVDAEVLYALLRHLKPRRVVEIGSGFSTLLMLRAATANAADGKPLALRSIEPYPREFLVRKARAGRLELIQERVEKVALDRFEDLAAGDVLFIDSSHVIRTGGDVQRELLEIVPRLAPGVYVHLHDIFLPREYPRQWVVRNHWFWSEQYLLQAFLAFNSQFEVVLAHAFLHLRRPDLLARLVPSYDSAVVSPASFWMRRKPPAG
jgi:predicted O-methyltransferase YrrM